MNRIVALVLIGLFLLGGYVAYTAVTLPNVRKALETGIVPTQTSQILARDGSVVMSYGKYRHQPVHMADIPPNLVDALLATEDRRFYLHKGIDPIGILRAVVNDLRGQKIHEGGSTITQQLARNIFLSSERSFQRKVKEALLAIKLEQQLTKEQILELYLNNVYFGEGAYGIGAASKIYFGKRPKDLTLDECALLAGMPQAPSRYNPFDNPELAIKRRAVVLQNLVETGKISKATANRLETRKLNLNPAGRSLSTADKAPFFNHMVIETVLNYMDLDEQSFWQQGLKVHTTLDPQAQEIAEKQVRSVSNVYGRTGANQQAALFSIDNHGRMIAYVGGKDYGVSQFDRVTQAKRLAGSLFKVFVYTTAMSQNISPLTVYRDAPVQFGTWAPQNYDKQHHGLMTIAQALVHSNNIVAVKVTHEVTPQAVIETAQKMGITSPMQPNLSIALGAVDVNLREMTSAFSILANNGVAVTPYAIERITDRSGRLLYQHQAESRVVLKRVPRDTMVRLMQGVVRFGTGRGADIGRPVAGKTGTSDDYRDAWFIGFTPDITTGVWVGNDNNSQMPGITGGSIPARIWHNYMGQILARQPKQNFNLTYAMPLEDKDFFAYNPKNLSESEAGLSDEETQNIQEGPEQDINNELNPQDAGAQEELPPGTVPPGSPNDRLTTPPRDVPVEGDRFFDFHQDGSVNQRFNNAPPPPPQQQRQPQRVPVYAVPGPNQQQPPPNYQYQQQGGYQQGPPQQQQQDSRYR